ncbi:MAG TPA: hypothetical protein VN777_09710 [Terriglobales bacterium]|nr:hypothetical protein [Terriglobales bacterium]
MSNSSQTELDGLQGAQRSSGDGVLRRVFVGEQGVRAGWSALLFVAIFLILEIAAKAALGHFVLLHPDGPVPPSLELLGGSCDVLMVLAATWVMARIEKRPLLSYGYTADRKVMRLVSGAVWGFLGLSVLIGVLWKAGLLVIEGLSPTGVMAWQYTLAWGLVCLLTGIFEESLLRGYLATQPSGNPLWSGGPTGPEGSALMLPLLFMFGVGMWMWWGRKKKIYSIV